MPRNRKILLSGVKPTGRPHIGNYFGAMKQFVDLFNTGKYECYFMIADYHALNMLQNGPEMKENIIDLAIDYIAIGLDHRKAVLFKQSDVSEHTELAWIFDSITTMPYLMRAHAYKDAEAKNKEISVGAFNYPMLMAADILLYDADIVPVGQDQKQHIEYARDTAEKFNRLFGNTFKLPEPYIMEDVKTVPGIDGRKMSKSYGNDISLFASDDEVRKKVMAIVTDSAAPGVSAPIPENVFNLHLPIFKALGKGAEASLKALYESKQGRYKDMKELLVADMIEFITPMRKRREELSKKRSKIISILKKGGKKASKRTAKKMEIVRAKIGVKLGK